MQKDKVKKVGFNEKPLGLYNLEFLLEQKNGVVSYNIFDSGVFRKGKSRYKKVDESKDEFKIVCLDKPERVLILPKILNLTPDFLILTGLYLGDGSKAGGRYGPISFSQREPNLANFMRKEFAKLFGNSVKFIHRIGEDGLFFFTEERLKEIYKLIPKKNLPEIKKIEATPLEKLVPSLSSTVKTSITKYKKKKNLYSRFGKNLPQFLALRPFMEKYMESLKHKEFEEHGIQFQQNDELRVNIRLPGVKGSRKFGKSSRSDELDVVGGNYFKPLLFRIFEDIEESIVQNKRRHNNRLEWKNTPDRNPHLLLDIANYLSSSSSTEYVRVAGKKRYVVSEKNGVLIVKKLRGVEFKLPRKLELSPLIFLFLGLYLAEGHTTKWKVFSFFNKKTEGLKIGFTGSENNTLTIFIRAMSKFLIDHREMIDYWRIKVGSKYFAEVGTLGLKLGVPILRRGEKGQGASGSLELVLELKEWAEGMMPVLKEISDYFDHLEFTGAGIPRVDVFYRNSPAIFLFALMNDTVVSPNNIERYTG